MVNYKDTCRLPKTTFPLTAELPKNEPVRYAKWEEDKVYDRMKRDGENPFVLHDGPPYANGDIHIGHGLNKILKDFIVKHHFFKGRAVSFIPGWDCHGLPIEQKARPVAGTNIARRQMCRDYAKKQIENQMGQFKALGILADWENHYETMDSNFESGIYQSLYELFLQGLVKLHHKPVLWSCSEGTALADAEIEYQDKKDDSVYVVFPIQLEYELAPIHGLIVWTTTPWTLSANVAVALNPSERYGTIVVKGKRYVAAKKLIPNLVAKGIGEMDTGREFTALEIKNHGPYFNPMNASLTSEVVFADFVRIDSGTGIVHIAPAHGEEDYEVGKQMGYYGVRGPALMYVNNFGSFTKNVTQVFDEKYVKMNIFDANKVIIEDLEAKGHLLKVEEVTHSYPFSSRSGKPMIYRATKQWFVDLDFLRSAALSALEPVEFVPEINKHKLRSMIESRPDWCISRQRLWGVPIAFNHDTNADLYSPTDPRTFEKGFDVWWADESVNKCMDILDVWFDSGLTWKILNGRQADLYLEGHDQHRGWFQSSLWLSVALTGKAPFKKVLTHGFVMDGKGEKMAKSKGNVISPSDIAGKHGSEVLRYWAAITDYSKDVCISQDILNRCVEGYKKVRNSLRYLLANLPDTKVDKPESLLEIDAWILSKSKKVFDSVYAAFERCEFCTGMHELSDFLHTDMSAIYMDAIKDRMYCGTNRQSTEYAMSLLLKSLTTLLAPILTYTMDELFSHFPKWLKGNAKDVFDLLYEPLPVVDSSFDETHWKNVLDSFNAAVEPLRKNGTVKDTMELVVCTNSPKTFNDVAGWLSVTDYKFVGLLPTVDALTQFTENNSSYWICRATGEKCNRCRKRNAKNELCDRCSEVIAKK